MKLAKILNHDLPALENQLLAAATSATAAAATKAFKNLMMSC
jgi:hypothetical protein